MKFHCIFIIGLALLLTCCSAPLENRSASTIDPDEAAIPWPTKDWETSPPEQQGIDPELLAKMQAAIRDRQIRLHSLLIIRNGVIVSETYYGTYRKDSKGEIYSVTKSFTSTLVGIALDQGKLKGVNQHVIDLLTGRSYENMDARKQSMTVENLLTMTSGLNWVEGDSTYRKMYTSPDWVQMVMDHPLTGEPGSDFLYCSGCSHVLSAVVQEVTGDRTLDFAKKHLFGPLGIEDPAWEIDRQGIASGGWGLSLTPREMAKLGYLFLNKGVWDGRQIVSGDWVKAATTRHVGTDGRLGYGYQWWTYYSHNAYAALGRYGQTIFVAPDLDLIVVTTAQIEEGHDPVFELIDHYILPAVK